MDRFLMDLRLAVRQLARNRGFAFVAMATIGLGIGANTAIFSVVNQLLLRPPPHVQSFDRLVSIYTSDYSGPPYGASSWPDVRDFRAGAPALSGIAAYTIAPFVLSDASAGRAAELALGQVVSANFFDVLGVGAAQGRTFEPTDDEPGRENVVVLAHDFWTTRYGADPSIIGQTVRLAGIPFTVIGIAPPEFRGLVPAVAPSFFVPIGASRAVGAFDPEQRGSRGLLVVGRLADGATEAQAAEQLRTVATALSRQHPGAWADVRDEPRRVTVLPAKKTIVPPQLRGPVTAFAGVLMAVVGALLLICCANIANLLLVRATARQREMGVRLALGAGRGRLIRQLLTESLVLAGGGAVIGIALAFAGTQALARVQLPLPVDVRLRIEPDLTVLVFALVLSVAAGLLAGLAPALMATRQSLNATMRTDHLNAPADARRLGLRATLAGGQIAVAIVLLIVAGLLIRSLIAAQSMNPGFRTTNMLFVNLVQDENAAPQEQMVAFQQQLRERVLGLPGVSAVSYTNALPLGGGGGRRSFAIEGYAAGETEDMELHSATAGPGFFDAMGIPLLAGRDLTPRDAGGAPRVAVVNEAFVRRYLRGENPIGRRISRGSTDVYDIEIVGLVRDGKYRSLAEEPLPFVWLAADQNPTGFTTLVVHASAPAGALAEAVRQTITQLSPDVAITNVVTAGEHLSFALMPQRAGAMLLGMFGALGLALAMLGIYGVMAYSVSRRSREIGIRLAIGARPDEIVRMVLRQGMKIAAIGAVTGIVVAAAISRLIEFLLFGIRPLDPITFAAAAVTVAAVALLANWIPARRTTRVEAAQVLRYE